MEESLREQVVVGRFKQIGSADFFPHCCTPAYCWHDLVSKSRDVRRKYGEIKIAMITARECDIL